VINGLIVSKNRACQLRLLLESISVNAPSLLNKIKIIYTSTSDDFEKGYEKLKSEKILPNIIWEKEKDFIPDFLDALKTCESEYFCGMVDDCVIYKKIPTQHIEELFSDDMFCFSLRLGLNTTTQFYMADYITELREYHQTSLCIKWDWTKWSSKLNYGYPISLDGHIFRTKEISDLSHMFKFDKLRYWEGIIAGKCRKLTKRNMMMSFRQNILFSIPVNCVQEPPLIAGLLFEQTEEEINQNYLNNYVIDLNSMEYAFQNVSWTHNEFPLPFKIGEETNEVRSHSISSSGSS